MKIGRFSKSTAQNADLSPVLAMLQAHTLSVSVLPDLYAAKSKVERCLDLQCKLHLVLESASRSILLDASLIDLHGGWGFLGAIAQASIGELPAEQAVAVAVAPSLPSLTYSE